jgi:hypothetical protein
MFSHNMDLTKDLELHRSLRWIPGYFPADKISAGSLDLRLLQVCLVQPHFDNGLPETRLSIFILILAP